jgi:hypothetical protein
MGAQPNGVVVDGDEMSPLSYGVGVTAVDETDAMDVVVHVFGRSNPYQPCDKLLRTSTSSGSVPRPLR